MLTARERSPEITNSLTQLVTSLLTVAGEEILAEEERKEFDRALRQAMSVLEATDLCFDVRAKKSVCVAQASKIHGIFANFDMDKIWVDAVVEATHRFDMGKIQTDPASSPGTVFANALTGFIKKHCVNLETRQLIFECIVPQERMRERLQQVAKVMGCEQQSPVKAG